VNNTLIPIRDYNALLGIYSAFIYVYERMHAPEIPKEFIHNRRY